MEPDRQVLLEESEIRICGEDGHLVSHCYSADEKVGVRTLNPFTATEIVELGGSLEISGCQIEIGKGTQMIAKLRELISAFDSGKDFLPHRPYQLNPQFLDQFHQLGYFRTLGSIASPQRHRPDTGVDKDLHAFLRCSL
jgi:hypothetical protein